MLFIIQRLNLNVQFPRAHLLANRFVHFQAQAQQPVLCLVIQMLFEHAMHASMMRITEVVFLNDQPLLQMNIFQQRSLKKALETNLLAPLSLKHTK